MPTVELTAEQLALIERAKDEANFVMIRFPDTQESVMLTKEDQQSFDRILSDHILATHSSPEGVTVTWGYENFRVEAQVSIHEIRVADNDSEVLNWYVNREEVVVTKGSRMIPLPRKDGTVVVQLQRTHLTLPEGILAVLT